MKRILILLSSILVMFACSKENTQIVDSGQNPDQMAAITGAASSISCYFADLSGKAVIPSMTTTDMSFGVLYSTSSGVLINTATKKEAQSFDSNYNFTITTDKISPGTTYYYRSYLSMGGMILYGEVKSFTTLSLPSGAVDLGLSVLWHKCNIGASKPEESGRYFAWGDVTGQTFNTFIYYEVDSNNNLKPAYDAAHVILGGNWRMPTKVECQELIDNCNCTWTDNYNSTGVAGRIFTSRKAGYTDKTIFLPAAGYVNYTLDHAGSRGDYWSSTFYYGYYSWFLTFDSKSVYTGNYDCDYGRSVRPVTE